MTTPEVERAIQAVMQCFRPGLLVEFHIDGETIVEALLDALDRPSDAMVEAVAKETWRKLYTAPQPLGFIDEVRVALRTYHAALRMEEVRRPANQWIVQFPKRKLGD